MTFMDAVLADWSIVPCDLKQKRWMFLIIKV